jgi:hypothetical protein
LVVTVTDRGTPSRSSTANVAITVSDVNDNTPAFAAASYHVDVLANLTSSSVVAEPYATDADGSSPNNAITYSLIPVSPSTNTKFTINSATGRITNTNRFFLGNEPNAYILTVRATDRGTSPRFSEVTLTVNVTAVNDFAPVFAKTSYSATVAEDIANGADIVTVAATDAVRLVIWWRSHFIMIFRTLALMACLTSPLLPTAILAASSPSTH